IYTLSLHDALPIDHVGPRAGDEHVALDREDRLARMDVEPGLVDEPVAVLAAQAEQRGYVEPVRVDERAFDRAHGDDPRPRVVHRLRGPRPGLAEALDRDRRALDRPTEALEHGASAA